LITELLTEAGVLAWTTLTESVGLAQANPELRQREVDAAEKITTELSSLTPTHGINLTKKEMVDLYNDIRARGIQEAITYVDAGGEKFIIDGNHRFYAAIKAGIENTPIQKEYLPYGKYKTTADLIWNGKLPSYWKFIK
jgi:hypothetical protein